MNPPTDPVVRQWYERQPATVREWWQERAATRAECAPVHAAERGAVEDVTRPVAYPWSGPCRCSECAP